MILYLLLFLWQLPQNIIALFMLPFLGKLEKVAYRNYCLCLKGSRMRGGISLGSFVFVSPILSENEYDVSHELDGHTKQSKILGPFYLLVIGLPSLLWVLYRRNNIRLYPNYYVFYTESWANRCAGLEVLEIDYGYYKTYKLVKA